VSLVVRKGRNDDDSILLLSHYSHMTEFDGKGCSGRNQVKWEESFLTERHTCRKI